MKIGVFTAPFDGTPLETVLDTLAPLGVQAIEVGVGGFPGSGHCDAGALLSDHAGARRWLRSITDRGLVVSALSAHANPLHPDPIVGAKGRLTLEQALELAELLEIGVVNTFSGCPGSGPGSSAPNWVTTPWPPEFAEILRWQWDEQAVPYWAGVAALAERRGVTVAIEPHPGFLVYNLRTLLELRDTCGASLAANFDPSHLWWQGADPVAVVRALADAGALAHVHAKDLWLEHDVVRLHGTLDNTPRDRLAERAWSFRTLGYGQGEQAWRDLVSVLLTAGYDGVLSIEHEDRLFGVEDGLRKSVELLRRLLPDNGGN